MKIPRLTHLMNMKKKYNFKFLGMNFNINLNVFKKKWTLKDYIILIATTLIIIYILFKQKGYTNATNRGPNKS